MRATILSVGMTFAIMIFTTLLYAEGGIIGWANYYDLE
jgi:hypothetical protein